MQPPQSRPADRPASPEPAASRDQDSQSWVRRLRLGERDALGPWYTGEYPRVHRLCLGFLGSRADAEDLAQNAMLHLAEQLHHWDVARPYEPWRNRLVVNLCRDHLRQEARRAHHEQQAAEGAGPRVLDRPHQDMEAREELEVALAWLAPREREAWVLVDMEGHPAVEAAEQLGLAASSVRASLSLARRKLREVLTARQNQGGLS